MPSAPVTTVILGLIAVVLFETPAGSVALIFSGFIAGLMHANG